MKNAKEVQTVREAEEAEIIVDFHGQARTGEIYGIYSDLKIWYYQNSRMGENILENGGNGKYDDTDVGLC